MAIYINDGIPGSGKSLDLARIALQKLKLNKKRFEETGLLRLLASNMKFSDSIEEEFRQYIFYWHDPEQLVKLRQCDVIWDEVATYLDSTQWANLPLEIKRWLQQHRKYGIDIYGTTQEFAMIDISMRRLVKALYHCVKIIGSADPSDTKSAVNNPWGLILIREVDRASFTSTAIDYKFVSIIPRMLFITKHLCSIYDTKQELVPGKYPPLRHITRKCNECGFEKVSHI
jgi:hypothetical protein